MGTLLSTISELSHKMKEILKIEGYPRQYTDVLSGFTDLKEGKGKKPDTWTYYLEAKGLLKEGKRYELTIIEL